MKNSVLLSPEFADRFLSLFDPDFADEDMPYQSERMAAFTGAMRAALTPDDPPAVRPLGILTTERGFAVYEFTDRYGQGCSLQKSSLASEDAIWFGVVTNMEGERVNDRMHLTQDHVAELLSALKLFAATGELK